MTDESRRPVRSMAWALLSFVGWVAAFAMAFFVGAAAGTLGLLSDETAGLRVDLAVVLALHGAFAFGAVQVAAWLALGTWPSATFLGAVVPASGVALAVLAELALHEWAEARYGYYDAELIGFTALLSVALVATATSSFGVSVAPRGAAGQPLGCLTVAGGGVLLIVLSNARGLADGIGPDAWVLAALVGLSGAYVIGAFALGVRRLRWS